SIDSAGCWATAAARAPVEGRRRRHACGDAVKVEIVTIGDELLLGYTVDGNAARLGRELSTVGIAVSRRTTVGDDAAAIVDALRDALDRSGAVITTGGLGPTSDDVTREAVAELFGRTLAL